LDIYQDGGALKTRLRASMVAGDAKYPEVGDIVHVNYTLLDGGDQNVLDSTEHHGQRLEFELGKGQVNAAFESCVASMQQGELALLVCKPPYTLNAPAPAPVPAPAPAPAPHTPSTSTTAANSTSPGTASIGSGPPPALRRNRYRNTSRAGRRIIKPWTPRKGELRYKIELCFWNPRDLPPWELGIGDRILKAKGLKDKGTVRFKAGKHGQALKRYKRAAKVISADGEDDGAAPILAALWNNMALCQLKIGNAAEAVRCCSRVLELEPSNPKAHFRLGEAYASQKEYTLAMTSLEKASSLEPTNKVVLKALARVNRAKLAEQERQKKLYGGMFSNPAFAGSDA